MKLYYTTHPSNLRNIIEYGINSKKDMFQQEKIYLFDNEEESIYDFINNLEFLNNDLSTEDFITFVINSDSKNINITKKNKTYYTNDIIQINETLNMNQILSNFIFEDIYYNLDYRGSFEYNSDLNDYNVFIYYEEEEIGNLNGTIKDNKLQVNNIFIEPKYRNQGIANWIYQESLKRPYINDIIYNNRNIISNTINNIYQKINRKNKKINKKHHF